MILNAPELVVRPSPFNQPSMWAVYPVVITVWLGCLYVVAHPLLLGASSFATDRLLVGLYAAVAVLPAGIAIGIVSAHRHSIYLTASHIGHTGFTGRPVEYRRTELARIVLFSERRYRSLYAPQGVPMPVIAFESQRGGELFRVSSRWWRLADIRRMALACGVPLEGSWQDIRDQR